MKRGTGDPFEVSEMFHILIWVAVTWMYILSYTIKIGSLHYMQTILF